MIVKERKKPLIILKLEALYERIPPTHPKFPLINEELRKREAGYKGEVSLDYTLSFLDEKTYYIFHDLRLSVDNHYFQVDTLILTHTNIFIIEVKNISGSLYFDNVFKQLIQKNKEGVEKAYNYPLTQLKRQEKQLKEWLVKNRLVDIPVLTLVVISNPQTIIRTSSEHRMISQKVIRKDDLPSRILQLENSKGRKRLNTKDIKKMSRMLLKQHKELDNPVLERFKIEEYNLLKGVICPSCKYLPMKRIHGNWLCPECNRKSKTAHLKSLMDYRLLIRSTITNSQLRDFLQVDSIMTANRLLQSLKLSYIGNNKDRVYDLTNFIIEEHLN